MNKAKLKAYAPHARKDFIAAVTARANLLGIGEHDGKLDIATAERKGDITLIAGQAWPAKVQGQRDKLIKRIQTEGFVHTMDAVAYTWFNRFAALRYMEIHDYLGHGHRVLSSREGGLPEILTRAADLAQGRNLPGLNATKVTELKLAGNKDGELYKMLLVAQCNALSNAMPFLFERIDDETELLLPDNLLRTDSLIHKLVTETEEEDWQQIEIIGWLYQFYISEKKDQVIGKVVKSEDIPAATQLFTPNWIVKYMVQNSLGAQWLATYPNSPLKAQMAYYIEPAEQTNEVKAQLTAITPSALNPEELTLIDPACGSGHILVEAYELFKAIYLERGYGQRDVAQLILEKNLFGLDIDERAAQLTGFALMMKGRADDRRLFERGVTLHVMALADSAGFDSEGLAKGVELGGYGLKPWDLTELKQLFEYATTFGSLIKVPEGLAKKLLALKRLSEATSPDLFVSEAIVRLRPLVQQAELLAAQYDAVVANPPYMGGKFMNALMKKFATENFPRSKSDLFAVSTERFFEFARPTGLIGLMTPFTWMFLKSYESLRGLLLETKTLYSLIQPEYHSFFDSAFVPVCAFVAQSCHTSGYRASFIKLSDFYGAELQSQKTLEAIRNPDCGWLYTAKPDEFTKIPGSPVAYWVSEAVRDVFNSSERIGDISLARKGLDTGENDRFLRLWSEVSRAAINFDCTSADESLRSFCTWYPINRGGGFRKGYGNCEYLINWKRNGQEIRNVKDAAGVTRANLRSEQFYFRPSLTWGAITSSSFSARYSDPGGVFGAGGYSVFASPETLDTVAGLFGSSVCGYLLSFISPTLNYEAGHISGLPFKPVDEGTGFRTVVQKHRHIARADWDAYERSWDFQSLPILTASSELTPSLESSYTAWITQNRDTVAEMKRLEEDNNRIFIDAYGLADELTPDVPIEQITLTVNPAYRYGGKLTEDEQWTRFRQDTMGGLVSYAIGCMMGRYSLDAPGLIYAHAGNVGFDAIRHKTFPADADGILPLTDELWFEDDAANRIREFLLAAWGGETLDENMAWLAESLGKKGNETPGETIRRYLSSSFFKDHLQTYKKRPIYWLFSSGKQGAFQALVYLHRYHEGTLARMRSEYVVPLTGKIQSRIEMLEKDAAAATSTAARNKLNKEIEGLRKKHVELLPYDEKLRHYADMRIKLDLDDGVKVNYGKFGDLLAEVKAVTGGVDD